MRLKRNYDILQLLGSSCFLNWFEPLLISSFLLFLGRGKWLELFRWSIFASHSGKDSFLLNVRVSETEIFTVVFSYKHITRILVISSIADSKYKSS